MAHYTFNHRPYVRNRGLRSDTIAFLIWRLMLEYEWNLTMAETAEKLNLPVRRVVKVCIDKGWTGRFRVTGKEWAGVGHFPVSEGLSFESVGESRSNAIANLAGGNDGFGALMAGDDE